MKKLLIINLICFSLTVRVSAMKLTIRPRSNLDQREVDRPFGILGGEPSCDELRAMWRFSKRQSRAAEVTNELPTYRDPFAYNIWEPLPRLRSVLAPNPPSNPPPERSWSSPVYGRIVRHPPAKPTPPSAFDLLYREIQRQRGQDPDHVNFVRPPSYRLPTQRPPPLYPKYTKAYQNFDRLKGLIVEQRARELHNRGQRGKQRNMQKPIKHDLVEFNDELDELEEEMLNDDYDYGKYTTDEEEEEQQEKMRLLKRAFKVDRRSAPEGYRKPLRRTSAYRWNDRFLLNGGEW